MACIQKGCNIIINSFLVIFFSGVLFVWVLGLLDLIHTPDDDDYLGGNSKNEIDYTDTLSNFAGKYDSIFPCYSHHKLVRHLCQWRNEQNQAYHGRFVLATQLACESEKHRQNLREPSDSSTYWGVVYAHLYANDYNKMPKVYEQFAQIAQSRRLNQYQFAEMVINFVQSMPYILIHPNSCEEDRGRNPFSDAYHRDRLPCLPNRRFGLQSPLEFMYNLKGDCDTRALFAYTVLGHFGYDVVVLGSSRHAMLGINLPAQGYHLQHQGKKYFFWETTAKGYSLGMIPPEFQKDNWSFSLYRPPQVNKND
ncbi:MAG: hypothetical protein MUE85_23730 [Microscillaceae bacterium]|jgi:hypothetical protein|nr:hypothetical protein [Microscillaceae bacterium]